MSPLDVRAASGQTADDQDPETNGMAENEDGRLEMDNLSSIWSKHCVTCKRRWSGSSSM